MENLLLSYAEDLNDAYPGHEFSVWSKQQLLDYFNEALCIIAAQRPDLFTELKVIKVDPCTNFLDLCDCNELLDVIGQSDKNGRVINRLTRRTRSAANTWTGRKRTDPQFNTSLSEYELLDNSSLVQVFPENLDPDKDFYVLVRCSIDARTYDLDSEPPDVRCAFVAAARHYVLFCAKMIDGEFSSDIRAAADTHLKMFATIMTETKKADEENRMDYKNKYEQAADARRGRKP